MSMHITRSTTVNHLHAETVIRIAQIHEGDSVLEVGVSTGGHYALPIAQTVGARGRLYALDVQQTKLDALRGNVFGIYAQRIEYVCADITQRATISIAETSMDVVVCINTLHQIRNKTIAIANASSLLKQGGRMIIIDFDVRKGCPYTALHKYFFSPLDLEMALCASNLKQVDIVSIQPYYWGLILIKQ